MTDPTHETTFYVQVQRRARTWRNGKWNTASAVKMTTEKPKGVLANAVVVKLTVRIPDAAFEPFAPSAVIDIPTNLTQQPIDIIVEDAA